MPSYDDWNNIDDEEEELQDSSFLDSKRDVILFCIDCSPSMLATHDDPTYEDLQSSHLYTALESAVQIQKKKVIVGPADSVGIIFFNTTRRNERKEGSSVGSEIKQGNYIYQHITPISAPKIQELMQLLEAAREDSTLLAREFPPMPGATRVPMGDIFTSCNWVLRDEAPKTSSKRVFLITDCDDPHQGVERLLLPAKTTLVDLTQAGVTVEPFFISDPERPFDPSKFYSSVLLPTYTNEGDVDADEGLPDRLSITRIDDLLAQMRFHEVPKRALFSITMSFPPSSSSAKGAKDGEGMKIGIKGYGLVTEQKKGSYKYFVDLGDRMAPAAVRSVYLDEDQQAPVPRAEMLFGMSLGATAASADDGDDDGEGGAGQMRTVPTGSRPYFTAEDVRDFRTLGLEPGIRLLGFKDASELRFEDQVKHSLFIYPDEMSYAGSKRTFTALLRSMLAKNKIGLALAMTRRNSSPIFCALLPQREETDEDGAGGWGEPGGFHLIPLPFADDLRAAPVEKGCRAGEETQAAAAAWIGKLCVKNGSYPPDSYPNPSLAYHNAQLEASAFSEEFDPEAFEDLTLPKIDVMHKRAGPLMKEWKLALMGDEAASQVIEETKAAGTKRKVAATDVDVDESEIRSKYEDGTLNKLTVALMKDFLKSKSQPVSGKKGELIERIAEWLDSHP